jgi:hypothetical protein
MAHAIEVVLRFNPAVTDEQLDRIEAALVWMRPADPPSLVRESATTARVANWLDLLETKEEAHVHARKVIEGHVRGALTHPNDAGVDIVSIEVH